ncbi:MAG: hypothetical protein L0H36_02840 [bacterium]|nr:hypothetical protein [bacterium]MDN5835546.1 hypothetical protein [bacterium]
MEMILFSALLGLVMPVLLGIFVTVINRFSAESAWAWLAVLPIAIASGIVGIFIGILITPWAALAAGPVVMLGAFLFMHWYGRLDRR